MSDNTTLAQSVATTTNAVTEKPAAKVKLTVSEFLTKNKGAIEATLPRVGLTAEAIVRTALAQIYKQPKLQQCDNVSLMRAILEAANLGLSFALGRAYLVPFNNKVKDPVTGKESWRMEATMMPGYQGLVDLVRRSAQVKTVLAGAVYAGDEFKYSFGLKDDEFMHVPATEPDDAKLTHAYCLIRFLDGGYQLVVLTRAQVDAVRKRSKSADNGPWVTDYSPMAIKTAVKRCTKLCPASIELSRAIELDNAAEMGERQQLSVNVGFPQLEAAPEPMSAVETVAAAAKKAVETARASTETKPASGEMVVIPEGGGEAPQEAPAEKAPRGQPPKCHSPFECKNKLGSADERELGTCSACQTKMTQKIREKNGTAAPPPTPLVPSEALSAEDVVELDRLTAVATTARIVFLKSNDDDFVKADKALESLSEGACKKFNDLPKYMLANPNFERVIEEAIS